MWGFCESDKAREEEQNLRIGREKNCHVGSRRSSAYKGLTASFFFVPSFFLNSSIMVVAGYQKHNQLLGLVFVFVFRFFFSSPCIYVVVFSLGDPRGFRWV